MAFEGLKSKLKIAGAVAGMGLASLIPTNEADAQVVLGFSGSQNVQVGQTVQYDLRINTQAGNVSSEHIDKIVWGLSLTNSTNATINSVSDPVSNDVFGSATTTDVYSTTLGETNSRDYNPNTQATTRPSNVNNLNYATATVTFNQPGSYTFSYVNPDVITSNNDSLSGLISAQTFTVNATAVPEPSTYALIAGAGALALAAGLRRNRRENIVDTEASTDESGRTIYTPKQD